MVSKIQKFPESTQNVLKLAACIGNSFDLEVLAIVNEKSLSATATELWEALKAELILPLTDAYKLPRVLNLDSLLALTVERVVIGYKFLHDRVQQAAYSLIPEGHKKETHLKIGQLFLRNTIPEEREEKIFDIVNQLNFGIELITIQSEKNELAELNLIAGRKAKASTAYEAAARYLTVGLELLAENSWHQHYDLTLALYVEAVEVAYLNTNFAWAAELAEVVLSFNEEEMLDTLMKTDNRTALSSLYLAKAHLFYLYKDYTQSIQNAKLAENYIESVMGTMNVSVHNFYYSLALLALYPTAQESEQRQYLKKLALHQRKMKEWAQHSPMNHRHKYALVEAEKARVLGKNYQAMDYYDRAIESAREHGYIQEEALANELAAEFYFSLGKEKIAQVYLMEAYYGYTRWGATSKLEDLSERYAQVFSRSLTRGNPAVKVPQMASYTTQLVSAALDLSTVIKASQAISDEIVLEKLLDKLMNILIENAGARTGLLLLSQADKWVLVAEGFVERDNAIVLPGIPIDARPELPVALINYVTRSQSTLVLNDATQEGLFTNESYIIKNQPKSILCLPIIYQSQLKGILYLENNLTSGAFTAERLEVLNLLSSQAAISLENASF